MPKRNSAVIDGVDEFDFDAPEVGPPSKKHYQKLILMHQKLILMHQKMVAVIGAAEEDAIKAPEKIKPSGEEKETEGAADEDAIKAPEEVACVGGAEATITASDDEWELRGSCHNYAGACVGGGEAPEIETIWGKHGTRIWCQYRGEWYHQVLGEGLPNQWVVYIPRRIEGDA